MLDPIEENVSSRECLELAVSLEQEQFEHARSMFAATREIKRLQNALDKIHVLARDSINLEYHHSSDRITAMAVDMSYALGRIQAIACVQRDLKVSLS